MIIICLTPCLLFLIAEVYCCLPIWEFLVSVPHVGNRWECWAAGIGVVVSTLTRRVCGRLGRGVVRALNEPGFTPAIPLTPSARCQYGGHDVWLYTAHAPNDACAVTDRARPPHAMAWLTRRVWAGRMYMPCNTNRAPAWSRYGWRFDGLLPGTRFDLDAFPQTFWPTYSYHLLSFLINT